MRIVALLPCSAIRFVIAFFVVVVLSVHASLPQRVMAEEPTGLSAAAAIEKLLVASIEKAEKSVVAIGIFQGNGNRLRFEPQRRPFDLPKQSQIVRPDLDEIPDKYGTGVAIGERLILTNHHVVLNAEPQSPPPRGTTRPRRPTIFIRMAGHAQWIHVTIKGADPRTDLAVLEIAAGETAAPKLTPMKMAAADTKVKKGQIAVSLGNPYGIASDGEVSASWGIISNVGRRVAKPRLGQSTKLQNFGGLIQTDAKLNLGTSGGALINLKGEMVGLTTSLAATAGYETPAGYAIAVDETFHRVVKLLSEGREVEHGLIGVFPAQMPTHNGAEPRGVLVTRTIRGVPAEVVLERGDLITHINEKRVHHPTDLMLAIGQQPAGAKVTMRVEKDHAVVPPGRQSRQVTVQLNKYEVKEEKVVTKPRPAWRGLHVDYPREVMVGLYRRDLASDCLLVTKVDADSPAALAGIQKGSLIQQAAGEPLAAADGSTVAIPEDFLRRVATQEGPIVLNVRPPDPRQLFADVVIEPAAVTDTK